MESLGGWHSRVLVVPLGWSGVGGALGYWEMNQMERVMERVVEPSLFLPEHRAGVLLCLSHPHALPLQGPGQQEPTSSGLKPSNVNAKDKPFFLVSSLAEVFVIVTEN